jgi:hypothetical protein
MTTRTKKVNPVSGIAKTFVDRLRERPVLELMRLSAALA